MSIKKGDSVYVDFVMNDEVDKDGDDVKRFKGCAVVDLVEDGRVFGRLPDGTPFMCGEEDVRRISDVSDYCKELDSDTCSDIRNHISPLTRVIDR